MSAVSLAKLSLTHTLLAKQPQSAKSSIKANGGGKGSSIPPSGGGNDDLAEETTSIPQGIESVLDLVTLLVDLPKHTKMSSHICWSSLSQWRCSF